MTVKELITKENIKHAVVVVVSALPYLLFFSFIALKLFDLTNVSWAMVVFIPVFVTGAFVMMVFVSLLVYGLLMDFLF